MLNSLLIVVAAAAVVIAWRQRARRQRLELRQSELDSQNISLRRSLSQLSVGFVLVDGSDTILFQNKVADALLGKPVAQYWGAAQHLDLVNFLRSSKGSASGNREIKIVNDEDSSLVNAVILELDNEQRVLLLQNLEAEAQAHLRLREFVANASHELKTPLSAIIGMLDLLPHMPAEKQVDLIERLQKNASSLANLVDDLLTLSRAESVASSIDVAACDVTELASEVVEKYRLKANFKKLNLELQAPGELKIVADKLALERVMSNLVENALTYTENGGVIVRVQDGEKSWVFEVEDSGPGIDAKHLPQLFQRFFRIDPARSRALGGTGLGLSIVRNFIERMDGTINVESTIGAGSIFRVELPK